MGSLALACVSVAVATCEPVPDLFGANRRNAARSHFMFDAVLLVGHTSLDLMLR